MNSNVTVTANFIPQTYSLYMDTSPNAGGSTTPGVGSHSGYSPGSVVPVSATPSAGWTFVNWTGPVAATNTPSTTVTMNSDVTVTANFNQVAQTYDLVIATAPVGGGTTTPAEGFYLGLAPGTVVDISARPNDGWTFMFWTTSVVGSVADENAVSTTVTVNTHMTVMANFIQTSTYTLTMAVNGAGTTTPAEGAHTYNDGDVVDISATPAQGYAFVNWTGGAVADANSATTTVIMDGDKTVTANFSQNGPDAPLVLSPEVNNVLVGQTFNVEISTNAANGQQVSALDAFVDFDPVYLEVVDAKPTITGIQIDPGTTLPNVVRNTVDNALGRISFGAGTLEDFPSGPFLVATITFRAKVETAGTDVTPITISLDGSRTSMVAFEGNAVAGRHVDTNVDIDPGTTIYGHLTLQGSQRPPSGRAVGLTVKLFTAGQYAGAAILTGTPVYTYTPTTVDTGSNAVGFQIDGVIAGAYDILVVNGHTLHVVKRGVVVGPPSVDVTFGSLLEGNANNDSIVNIQDFSVLAATYGKTPEQTGWNANADFDRDGNVNSLDFSLLAANYMKTSPWEAQ